jgi:hypothetical protein
MTEPVAHIVRISVTYVKSSPDGARETHIVGLASKVNMRYIQPERLRELHRVVALCCEEVIAHQQKGSSVLGREDSCGRPGGIYEGNDGHRTVTTTESDSASHQ